MHHFTFWTLIISRINRVFCKSHSDSDWQLNVNLAHSVEHWDDDQKVLSSIPTWSNFWLNLFCSSPGKPLLSSLHNLGKTRLMDIHLSINN